jgi:HEAT repeat protein
MGPSALQLASTTGKQAWLWETTVIVVGVLIVLNLLLFLAVFGRRFRELLRGRRSARFRKECEQLLDELGSGTHARDPDWLRGRIARFDELERPIAATMLIERIGPASAEERAALLKALRDVGAVEALLRSTRRRSPWRRALAVRTLGLVSAEEAVPALIKCLSDHSRYVREAAVRALGRIDDPRALPALADLFADPRRAGPGIVHEALLGLRESSAPVFVEGLQSSVETVRVTSCFGVASVLEPQAARRQLQRMLDDPAASVRAAACTTLGRLGGPLPEQLVWAVRDRQLSVRRAAASALGSYDHRVIPPLLDALEDPDRDVALRAGESLVRLGRLPQVGPKAKAAIDEARAWPLETALILDSLGAV